MDQLYPRAYQYAGPSEFFGRRFARIATKAAMKALWFYCCNNCNIMLSPSKLRVTIRSVIQEILLCDDCKRKYADWTEHWSSNGNPTRNYRPSINQWAPEVAVVS